MGRTLLRLMITRTSRTRRGGLVPSPVRSFMLAYPGYETLRRFGMVLGTVFGWISGVGGM